MDKRVSLGFELAAGWCGPLFLATFVLCLMWRLQRATN
jgi:hypothetical protein